MEQSSLTLNKIMKKYIFFATFISLSFLGFMPAVYAQAASNFAVVSPNGGQTWRTGETKTITWTGSGNTVQILLFQWSAKTASGPYDPTAVISQSVQNMGSFAWQIPASVQSGQYFVRVVCTSACSTNALDDSDTPFNIETAPAPSLSITSPNGGEVWMPGQTHTVTWIQQNVDRIKIYLVHGSPLSTITIDSLVASFTPIPTNAGNGTYTYTVPFNKDFCLSRDYYIRIVGVQDSASKIVEDLSNTPFRIVQPPTISSLMPDGGPVASQVLLQGSCFISFGSSDNVITFSTTGTRAPASYTTTRASGNGTTLPFVIPNRITQINSGEINVGPGVYQISLTNAQGTSNNMQFTVTSSGVPSPTPQPTPIPTPPPISITPIPTLTPNPVPTPVPTPFPTISPTPAPLNNSDQTLQSLLEQIKALQDQLSRLQSFQVTSPPAPSTPTGEPSDTGTVVNACVALTKNLTYRSRDASTNEDVSALQDFLQAKGYLNSEPTGFFGIATLKAVKKLQSDNHINPTGFVGALTRAKINELSCQ
jgi:hypothetical protein